MLQYFDIKLIFKLTANLFFFRNTELSTKDFLGKQRMMENTRGHHFTKAEPNKINYS